MAVAQELDMARSTVTRKNTVKHKDRNTQHLKRLYLYTDRIPSKALHIAGIS